MAAFLRARRRDYPRGVQTRAVIQEVLDALLAATPRGATLELDAIGDAIGARAVTMDEMAWLIDRIEAEGRVVGAPMPGDGVTALGAVLRAARALRTTSGRTPTVGEIAAQAGLEEREVRRALLLAKVMSR
jgi:hypothetical protein